MASLSLFAAIGSADPITLRMAAIAPDGTSWAHELHAFARDIETGSRGELHLKWYLGGIAGDELGALERMRRGQLDGAAGAIFCQRLAPSLGAVRLPGMYQSREEALYILSRMKPLLDEEFRRAGFVNLGEGVFGMDVLFSRRPIRALGDMTSGHYWVWSLDPIWQATLVAMGVNMVATALEELAPAYQRHDIDAFFAAPSAALAYQWSTQASYVTAVDAAVLPLCLVLANSALDPLPLEAQQLVRTAAAKFMSRFDESSHELENELMNGLFQKQGLTRVPLTPQLQKELMAATRAARPRVAKALLPPGLLPTVEKMLDEYRAQRRNEAQRRP
jgi:TRAP-type C4-dicarboxylate transport system substrate-binding protein